MTIQAQILDLLRRLRTELGMAVLIITHDLGVVAGFADRLAVMYAGRLVELGPTETLLADPAHPYTIGLLRSLPRLDRPRQAALTPIEGSPPDLASRPRGLSVRAALRLAPDPLLDGRAAARRSPAASALEDATCAGHEVACHNQPTRDEAIAGQPLTPGFVPAPPPAAVVEAIVAAATAEVE